MISGFLSAAVAIPWKTTLCIARENKVRLLFYPVHDLSFKLVIKSSCWQASLCRPYVFTWLQRAPGVQCLLPSAWPCTDPLQANGYLQLPGSECTGWGRGGEVFSPLPSPSTQATPQGLSVGISVQFLAEIPRIFFQEVLLGDPTSVSCILVALKGIARKCEC